jgi:DNA-binding CsgD family transcriptional regulator
LSNRSAATSRRAPPPTGTRPAVLPVGGPGGFSAADGAGGSKVDSPAARVHRLVAATPAETIHQRRLLADVCRLLLARKAGDLASPTAAVGEAASPLLPPNVRLAPRVAQTLDRLLLGDSEKQVAQRLNVSQHTVHIYVKTLYRKLNVNSRGELLAKFVRPR